MKRSARPKSTEDKIVGATNAAGSADDLVFGAFSR
jgi:hypothetical protein